VGAFVHISLQLEAHKAWGMPLILQIQEYRTKWLDVLMRFFSLFGFEVFFVLVPFLTFIGSAKEALIGVNLIHLINYTMLLGSILKSLFAEPRPIWMEETIEQTYSTGSIEYSYPSGHAYSTTVCWLLMSISFPKIKFLPLLSIFIIVGASFSRVYFGVHFPHDVMAGVACGVLLFQGRRYFLLFEKKQEGKSQRINLAFQWILLLSMIALIFFKFSAEQRDQQKLSLFYSTGALLAALVLRPLMSTNLDESNSYTRLTIRATFGILPNLLIGFLIYKGYKMRLANLDALLFIGGFLSTTLFSCLAARMFGLMGLGKAIPCTQLLNDTPQANGGDRTAKGKVE